MIFILNCKVSAPLPSGDAYVPTNMLQNMLCERNALGLCEYKCLPLFSSCIHETLGRETPGARYWPPMNTPRHTHRREVLMFSDFYGKLY